MQTTKNVKKVSGENQVGGRSELAQYLFAGFVCKDIGAKKKLLLEGIEGVKASKRTTKKSKHFP